MESGALLVFLKRPTPGEVKTRLAPDLGAQAAADLYRVLAEETLRRTVPRPGDYGRLLCFAPANARREMREWLPGETWLAQKGGDLGDRMAHAFREAFRRGARRAVLIGSDAPSLTRELVLTAFAALGDNDLVLGPARDGGYYLVGLSRPCDVLFREVPWSTPEVLRVTLERAGALGLRAWLLERLRDIDTLDDVRESWAALRPLLQRCRAPLAAVEGALTSRLAPAGLTARREPL